MGLLHYISYIAVAATLCFVILSLASGLLYISELIEEHAKIAKYYGQKGIYVIIGLQTVLYLTESLPLHLTLFTIGCHLVYLQNFSASWPLISLTSPTFVGSCVLVVTDHFLWFFHFTSRTASYNEQARRYGTRSAGTRLGFKEIASFFGICVWLAPLFLFLSLSANDNALPTTGSSDSIAVVSGSVSAPASSRSRVRSSLFKSVFSLLPFGRRAKDEGIIAPHSPLPPLTPTTVYPPSQSMAAYQDVISPPRSPIPEFSRSLSQASSIRLSTPPRRFQGSERVGLGLRSRSSPGTVVGEDSVFQEQSLS